MSQSCADQAKDCGVIDNMCGQSLDCGTCFPNATCGADNTCGPCAKFTCANKGYHCGMLDDGCGGAEYCGDYMRFAVCDFSAPPTTCQCPANYPYGWLCAGGQGQGVTPDKDCIQNPMEPVSGWCCKSQL